MIVREALIPHTGRKLSERNKCETVWMKKEFQKIQDELWSASIMKEDEEIVGVVKEMLDMGACYNGFKSLWKRIAWETG